LKRAKPLGYGVVNVKMYGWPQVAEEEVGKTLAIALGDTAAAPAKAKTRFAKVEKDVLGRMILSRDYAFTMLEQFIDAYNKIEFQVALDFLQIVCPFSDPEYWQKMMALMMKVAKRILPRFGIEPTLAAFEETLEALKNATGEFVWVRHKEFMRLLSVDKNMRRGASCSGSRRASPGARPCTLRTWSSCASTQSTWTRGSPRSHGISATAQSIPQRTARASSRTSTSWACRLTYRSASSRSATAC